MIRAGLPATTAPGGTSLVTTLPAPIMAFSPMVMPHSSVDAGTDGGPALDQCAERISSPPRFATGHPPFVARGITVVDESDIVADENFILQSYAFANEGVAGNLAAVADFDSFLNLHKGANLHVIANFATVKIDEIQIAGRFCPI